MNPVVIIGAPRSGTNMLRDALVTLPGIETWPCDEINYIWRHGNLRYRSDEFPAELAREEVRQFVRDHFSRLARRSGAQYVVEKTCANALRVGFVEAILPEARFVYIKRNSLDAIASAVRRWCAPLDLRYVMRKARFVPPSDLPYYALRYAANRLRKRVSTDGRLASWGPRFDGMESMLRTHSLPEVCAHQWLRCVSSARCGLSALSPERVYGVRYERFVENPCGELNRILVFLGASADMQKAAAAVKNVTPTRVGSGERDLGPFLKPVRAIVGEE